MNEPIFSPEARRQLRNLRVHDQRKIVEAVRKHLVGGDPREETRNKFRLRRASAYADYELRVGELRVFYRVQDPHQVYVALIGVKRGSKVIVDGEEFLL